MFVTLRVCFFHVNYSLNLDKIRIKNNNIKVNSRLVHLAAN